MHAQKQTRLRVLENRLPESTVLVAAQDQRPDDARVGKGHTVVFSRNDVTLVDSVGAPPSGAGRDTVKEPNELEDRGSKASVARRVRGEIWRPAVVGFVFFCGRSSSWQRNEKQNEYGGEKDVKLLLSRLFFLFFSPALFFPSILTFEG